MSRKDYEAAARIVQELTLNCGGPGSLQVTATTAAFVRFFRQDNPRFDEDRFRRACVPGANVKARS